jgi:hypothetical protein
VTGAELFAAFVARAEEARETAEDETLRALVAEDPSTNKRDR